MLKDISVSTIIAGLMAVLVSYSGPLAIFFQAAHNAGISTEMMTSWVWAISIGAAVTGIVLSVWFRIPVITAWSAPGTVLLVTLFPELSINEAVAAYITAAVIIFLIGITGLFDRVVHLIPRGVAAAMMAGILFDFGLGAFRALESVPLVTTVMILGFVLFKHLSRAYFLVLMVGLGIVLSMTMMDTHLGQLEWRLASPVLIVPEWSWSSTLGLALPLVIVSLTGQFLPGFAILKASGYAFSSRPIITLLSLISIPTAFFGGITTVIAAITASICTSADAHENPDKRYIAGVANGLFYLIGGIFAGSIVLFFTSFPTDMIAIIAGLALLGAICNSLSAALDDREHLDASLVTFMATASGISIWGVGAAFWGVVLGSAVYALNEGLKHRMRRAQGANVRS
ncbi:benzoate/H(+) symporter BenE family transporter [Marinobacterium sediminicola]|uniref:Benzoate membrane transport protein n=1 Tax=Marinobacterium sediminicola TaxID=518898 RepID=A0ABY1S159_9GAMM|nr:benzoate/H(+) symporter BenE family transporter [Marinobacterium sediminicola]ULG68294.1 benzoate/H(+) symporter BenE family transporter [Marinobacterium sediminicola]SMR74867.1 benzoate membrane transport protein [Marinobacterium sediminicola]